MKKLKAFLLGMYEFRLNFTTYISHPDLMRAYDWGREWAHRLTFRRYEANYKMPVKLPQLLIKGKHGNH